MAVTFSDLHTEGGLKALEAFLAGKSYISGDKFTKDDVRVYAAVHGVPGDSFPNVCKWYNSVSSKLASSRLMGLVSWWGFLASQERLLV
ncbi:unnamed protein product [Linum tenue]|uniref:Uncharacterized protein n=1 Tax=Linum tenue TaxID=586396 RepID=A0AAV0QU85_9ROSI|nr:unnamed protein product [Linum tenue]